MGAALRESNAGGGRLYTLERAQLLRLPREQVFDFFADAGNLEAITPGFLKFSIVTPRPIRIAAGTRIDYRLRLAGIPLRWQSMIEQFEPPLGFVDVQTCGPYRSWRHTHAFRETREGTLVTDRVEYSLPGSVLGTVAHWLFVGRTLDRIFAYRQRRVAELLGGDLATA